MRIFITGGTGLIGSQLVRQLIQRGDEVSVLTRSAQRAKNQLPEKVKIFTALDELKDFNLFDAVINLAGEPIFAKRWTCRQQIILRQSRLDLTRQLVQRINQSATPPVFISGSATGIYADRGEQIVTEETPISVPSSFSASPSFSTLLCMEWEQAAWQARTRVCLLRTGIVLSPQGGMLQALLPLYQWGLGGKLGAGKQFLPWISLTDMSNAILFLLDHADAQGVFNLTAPQPLRNQQFNQQLARFLQRPAFCSVPAWGLKMLLGKRAELLLDSQNVQPQALLKQGFQFSHHRFADYLASLSSALNYSHSKSQ